MKHLQFAILAMFASSACPRRPWLKVLPARPTPHRHGEPSSGFEGNRPGARVSNANECAPGYARPVWGPNSALLGYSCSNYANGS